MVCWRLYKCTYIKMIGDNWAVDTKNDVKIVRNILKKTTNV